MAESFSGNRKRPKEMPMSDKRIAEKKVRRAVVTGDIEPLRMWGKKGGETAQKNRREKREVNEYFDERLEHEEQVRREATNEHIVPFDPDDEKEAA